METETEEGSEGSAAAVVVPSDGGEAEIRRAK